MKVLHSGRFGVSGKMLVDAVIVAAGKGYRMGGKYKQFQKLEGKPLVYYSIKQFNEFGVDRIVLVVPEDKIKYAEDMVLEYFGDTALVVMGGKRRQDSVLNGLYECTGEIILIHDGVRPFIKKELIDEVVKGACKYGACAPGIPINDTIKLYYRNKILWTKGRKNLLQVQTPQGFRSDFLKELIKLLKQEVVTDEISIIERLNGDICLVFGDPVNIKITYPEDMELAKIISKSWSLK